MPISSAKVYLGTAASNGFILACGVATGIVSARLLQPEGRGLLAVILFWPQIIASIGIFGLNEAAAYRAAQSNGAKNGAVLATACWVAVALAACSVIAGYVLLPHLLGRDRIEWVFLAQVYLLFFIPGNFIALGLLAIDHGQRHFLRYNSIRMVPSVTYLAGLIMLWAWDRVNVGSVVWASLAGTVLVAFVMLIVAGRRVFVWPSWQEATRLLSFGARAHVSTILIIIGAQVDRIVVMTIWDNATVGMYAVALTVAYSCLAVITESLHTVMFPTLASETDAASRRTTLATGLRHGVALIIPSALFLILLCPWLIPFLFGQAFGNAVAPAIALLLAYIPLALRQIGARGLRGLGDNRAGTVTEAITLIVFLLTVWPLGYAFGLVGIGLALLVANIVSLAYLAQYLSKHAGIEYTAWMTIQAWQGLINYARMYMEHGKSSGGR